MLELKIYSKGSFILYLYNIILYLVFIYIIKKIFPMREAYSLGNTFHAETT